MNSPTISSPSPLKAILRPLWVRIVATVATIFGALQLYDAASNQFGWSKLPVLVSTIASAIPVWGWFILPQYVLLFAVLQYVRRQRLEPVAPVAVADPRLDGILAKQKAIIDDYQRMTAVEARLNGELDGFKTAVQAADQRYRMTHEVLEGKINSFGPLIAKVEENRVSAALNAQDLEKLSAVVEANAKRVRESFAALQVMDQIEVHESAMIKTADVLYSRLSAGETYTKQEWNDWGGHLTFWEANLSSWISLARWYAPDVEKRVMTVNEGLYDLDWTVRDDQIPTAEGTRKFRKFRILLSQWEDVSKEVHTGLAQVAFVGLSEKDMQMRPPPRY
jgi:hypothetical protein